VAGAVRGLREHRAIGFLFSFDFPNRPAAGGEMLEFSLGAGVGFPLADRSGVGEDVPLVEAEEFVAFGFPIPEEDLLATPGLILGEVEPHRDDAIQRADLVILQLVLGHDHVVFAHHITAPGGQSHVRQGVVGPAGDQLGRGQGGGGEVELVLDDLEELDGGLPRRIVVTRQGEDFPDPEILRRSLARMSRIRSSGREALSLGGLSGYTELVGI
jgi:hypothetical protein